MERRSIGRLVDRCAGGYIGVSVKYLNNRLHTQQSRQHWPRAVGRLFPLGRSGGWVRRMRQRGSASSSWWPTAPSSWDFASGSRMMAFRPGIIFVAVCSCCLRQLGKAKSSKTIRELFGKSRGVNLLAAAGVSMFGARDVWFVVGLPVSLRTVGNSCKLAVFSSLDHCLRRRAGDRAFAREPELGRLELRATAARVLGCRSAAVPIALAVIMNSTDVARPDLLRVVGPCSSDYDFR